MGMLPADIDNIQRAQREDDEISFVYQWFSQNRRPEWKYISHLSMNVKRYWANWDGLMLRNGLAYLRKFHDPPETDTYLLLAKDIMRLLHSNIRAGHLDVTRTVSRIKDRFDWPSLREDVELVPGMHRMAKSKE